MPTGDGKRRNARKRREVHSGALSLHTARPRCLAGKRQAWVAWSGAGQAEVERIAALKEVFLEVLPTSTFYQWMKLKGKEGGQNKFPRVLKKNMFNEWEEFIKTNS